MHRLIEENLEEFLDGSLRRSVQEQMEAHLNQCNECRDEVMALEDQSLLLRALRPDEELDPAAGFYARVLERIDRERPASFWDLLFNPAFNRQLAAASLMILLLVGGYLARDQVGEQQAGPARIIAVEQSSHNLGQNPSHDRDVVLANLVSYRD